MSRGTSVLLALGGLLAGCSTPAEPLSAVEEGAVFPHGDGYAEAGTHGLDFLADASTCARCHATVSAEEGIIPGCRSCHALFPHEVALRSGAVHGPLWLDSEDGVACTVCHGDDLSGGATGVSCSDCHAAWPHPEAWEEGREHGAWIASRGTVDGCLSCHRTEVQGAEAAVPGCRDCHDLYPHASDWGAGAQHGAAWLDEDTECGTCHGENADGGVIASSCRSCHGEYPHEAEWAVDHLASVATYGPARCFWCHRAGDGPTLLGLSCADGCHGG